MNLAAVLSDIIEPVYALGLLPRAWDTPESRVMLLAIGLQESRFEHRVQVGGPAHGFWQFEQGGGVAGVTTHSASRGYALVACVNRGIEPTVRAAYAALAVDDILAATFARLLLRTDPMPLPSVADVPGSWLYYTHNWRPGLPHPETWAENHAAAVAAVAG